jgi:hypothetical protein
MGNNEICMNLKPIIIDHLVRETKQGSEKYAKNDATIVQFIGLCIVGF